MWLFHQYFGHKIYIFRLLMLMVVTVVMLLFNEAPRVWAEKIYFVPKILMEQPHDCSY